MIQMGSNIKAIAIHLPQFHPFPENDAWWGKGFTEWTNVAKAKPLFRDHYQPHLPTDLGFYDLRLEEARIAQAELAKAYGIHGFCFYHYWFNGKRLLHRPLDDMIKTKTPDFPFMLCWANENWTRRWDGLNDEILIQQHYSEEDDVQHIRFLHEHFFSDDRYIRVNGKPFFLVYRPGIFPDIKRTLDVWRNETLKSGLGELYLGYVQSFGLKTPPHELGFDCAIEFEPDNWNKNFERVMPDLKGKIRHKLGLEVSPYYEHRVVSYAKYVDQIINNPRIQPDVFPAISPMWDNSARRKKGAIIYTDSTPAVYERWLDHIRESYSKRTLPDQMVFINAWNEWAEGNHLEPCQKWGRQYLEATQRSLQKS